MDSIFIVFGKEIKKDFSNVQVLKTKQIPNIGECFAIKGGVFRVIDKMIDYRQVEDYDIDKDDGRGGEIIYIYV